MTSFELFRLLNFLKHLHYIYMYIYLYFFLLKYIMGEVTSFQKENSNVLH